MSRKSKSSGNGSSKTADAQSSQSPFRVSSWVILFVLMMAFTIGLNIGLHGGISLHLDAQNHATMFEIASKRDPPVVPAVTTEAAAAAIAPPSATPTATPTAPTTPQPHKRIPILLLTCNRAELLQQTLASLLAVRGVDKNLILISQDGNMQSVKDVVIANNLALIQNTAGLRLRGGAARDGAARIAMHYKYSLTAAFDRMPDAEAIIVIEDDLLFSPDFLDYFESVAPVLAADKSLFAVSAWNDNGFKSKMGPTRALSSIVSSSSSNRSSANEDIYALRRTEFFPGLGWLLTRELYKQELEAKWPETHWDHWLRNPATHKGREIVYPSVPRTYHNGIKGTFMDLSTHNKYFRDIDYNTDAAVRWQGVPTAENAYKNVTKKAYENRIVSLITDTCIHIRRISQLGEVKRGAVACVWIDTDPNPDKPVKEFKQVGEFFGIWHEHQRGTHKGLHEFFFDGTYILLLNTFNSRFTDNYSRLLHGVNAGGGGCEGCVLPWRGFSAASREDVLRQRKALSASSLAIAS